MLWCVDAPYGKRARRGWGPGVPNRLAWCLMESVVLVAFYAMFALAGGRWTPPALAFAALLTLHYVNRAFVFPFRLRTRGKTMPLTVLAASVLFNTVNGTLLAWDFAAHPRDAAWFADPRFLLGVGVFFAGLALNWHSDALLIGLRRAGDTGYRIPHGGGFRWVTSPNLLGEIVEWGGFALATWSVAGLAFWLWTLANLVPRARANQRWYRAHFPDYPAGRRILLPGLW